MRKILVFASILLITACTKDKQLSLLINTGFLVVNEGNFNYGNASISFFDFQTQQSIHQAFQKINNFSIGDVAQSLEIVNNQIFIVVNNSGKIIVTDKQLNFITFITGLKSPRYLLPIDNSKAYVSDLYADQIYVIDLKNYSVTKTIKVGFSTEKMIKAQGAVFAVNWSYGEYVVKINSKTDQVEKITKTTYQPNSLVIDRLGRLWVLSDGGLWEGADTLQIPTIQIFDTANLNLIRTIYFSDINLSPSHLTINNSLDTIFFLLSAWTQTSNPIFGVYKMSIYDTIIPTKPIIPQQNATFYSLNYIPQFNYLAICDAKDFISNGNILIFNTQGKLILQFEADIIPTQVAFIEN